MTGAQAAVLGGVLAGLGVALGIAHLVPDHPDLREAVTRHRTPTTSHRTTTTTTPTPVNAPGRAAAVTGVRGVGDRVGAWAATAMPHRLRATARAADLAVLRLPVHRLYAQKITYALTGLVLPGFLVAALRVAGVELPVTIPLLASLALAAALYVLPDVNVRDQARTARDQFRRALAAYIELVALERVMASGPRQALKVAAAVGDAWVFRRIEEELARSEFSGTTAWDALAHLSQELDLPDLHDLADILRLSGEQNAQIYDTLRARATAMRTALLAQDVAAAHRANEKMTIPATLLVAVFAALLIFPALLSI